MSQSVDVIILDTSWSDNSTLLMHLTNGYAIKHVIPYTESYFNNITTYDRNGACHTEYQKSSEIPKFKYILERDGISRLLHG